MNRVAIGPIAATAAVVLFACDKPTIEPPSIHWGVQECASCSMSIVDEKAACALVRIAADGRLESLAFDDINCLVEIMDESPAPEWTVFVRDHSAPKWFDARTGSFVRSPKISTPMASGVASFPTPDGASSAGNGVPMDFAATCASIRSRRTVRE